MMALKRISGLALAVMMLWLALPSAAQKSLTPGQQLLSAIARKKIDDVRQLMAQNPGLVRTSLNEKGTTALTAAVTVSTTEVVTAVLKAGADPNTPTPITPLGLALTLNKLDMVQTLLSNGADPNRLDSKGRSPLLYGVTLAVIKTDADAAKACALLVKAGAKTDVKLKLNPEAPAMTVIEMATQMNATQTLQALQQP